MRKLNASIVGGGGFTIIEMLTAMVVFLLLTVIIFQIVSETVRSSGISNRRIEATRSARTALDTLCEDIATAVSEYGSNIMTSKDGDGNTTLAFLCASRSEKNATGTPRMGGVFFKVQDRVDRSLNAATIPMLCRGFVSVSWEQSIADKLKAVFSAATTGSGANVAVDSLGDMVFRMEAVYINADGDIVADAPLVDGTTDVVDIDKVRGIIVGVAALDKKTQALISSKSAQGMVALGKAFRPIVSNGQTPLDVWSDVIPTLDPATYPTVAQNIRLFQRTFYVK